MYIHNCFHRIDKIIGGGLFSGEITEIAGPPGSGKTQFCLTFAASTVMKSGCRVLYVDSTGSFSSFRFSEVLLSRSPQFQEETLHEHLRRMLVVTVADYQQLAELIENLTENVDDILFNLKAIIVDHIGTILSPLSWSCYKTGTK
ncbi:unnamed protein product [Soboliphyme baturini]|uniref:RecA family profile 1 domain-containing protein n=1 Tax=Soboliphyme baturini TaxID=241478 RepID=A0A3P7XY03_9BILA|nr:unnamed protein product [Soboliphyme baturini]